MKKAVVLFFFISILSLISCGTTNYAVRDVKNITEPIYVDRISVSTANFERTLKVNYQGLKKKDEGGLDFSKQALESIDWESIVKTVAEGHKLNIVYDKNTVNNFKSVIIKSSEHPELALPEDILRASYDDGNVTTDKYSKNKAHKYYARIMVKLDFMTDVFNNDYPQAIACFYHVKIYSRDMDAPMMDMASMLEGIDSYTIEMDKIPEFMKKLNEVIQTSVKEDVKLTEFGDSPKKEDLNWE